VTPITQKRQSNRKRRIMRRLRGRNWEAQARPMFNVGTQSFELAERARGLATAGVGVIQRLVRKVGLADAINKRLALLKRHLPYWESDHVLNIAYNILVGNTCLEDLELLRNDEVYLDALGAQRIPDPTTAGDFCRRFRTGDIEDLMEAVNDTRQSVWRQQPEAFFERAVIDVDGTFAPTTGEKKAGMELSYKGEWGYHPLVVSLANTGEPLYLVNRPGNRPSHEGAPARLDQAIGLCRRGGFRKVLLRGDTDFSLTEHLDRWDTDGVDFIFGVDASARLKQEAYLLLGSSWKPLKRKPKYTIETEPRARRDNVKEAIVRERGFKNVRLDSEQVADFDYRPVKCRKPYRVVAVRKNLTIERGERALFDDIRYFFYITNNREASCAEIVAEANARCDQENLIEQLKNGVKALRMPGHDLDSNWAYMVMAALAWTLKAWFALLLPEGGRWACKHAAEKRAVLRMEFKTFHNAFIKLPCQLVRQGRRTIFRLLSWNPWQQVFFRAAEAMRLPMRT
jgi:hypothetical protein